MSFLTKKNIWDIRSWHMFFRYSGKWGYVAAAYTTLIGFLWLLAVHMFLVWRIGFHHVYSYRFVCLLVVVLGVVTVGVNCLYMNDGIRWLFTAGYLLVLVGIMRRKRKQIREMIGVVRKKK